MRKALERKHFLAFAADGAPRAYRGSNPPLSARDLTVLQRVLIDPLSRARIGPVLAGRSVALGCRRGAVERALRHNVAGRRLELYDRDVVARARVRVFANPVRPAWAGRTTSAPPCRSEPHGRPMREIRRKLLGMC